MPTAAPGEAFTPDPRRRPSVMADARAATASWGWRKKSTCSVETLDTASSREINPSLAMSTAMRTAAWAVRLPSRVWSSHRRPRSTVNSMSCMSR